MIALAKRAKGFWSDDRGATAIEYGLIASIIGLAIVPLIASTSSGMASLFWRVDGYFTTVTTP